MTRSTDLDVSFFNDYADDVLEYLNEKYPFQTRKSKIASILLFLEATDPQGYKQAIEQYRRQMFEDIEEYDKDQDKQELTERQKQHMKSWEEIKQIVDKLAEEVKPLLTKSKTELTNEEKLKIQDYLISLAYGYQSPRRLLDYAEMKISNFTPEEDNYIDRKTGEFVFNKYKTAKTYGEQRIKIKPELLKLLKLWVGINESDYMILTKKGDKFTSPTLNLKLNNIFGKGVGVNLLRHAFVSSELKDMPKLTEMKETAEELGHNLEQMLKYKKNDYDTKR